MEENNTIQRIRMIDKLKILNRNALKYILVVLMFMDHLVGHVLGPSFPLFVFFRLLARLTFPIMAIFIADGFRYTHDRKSYIIRLLIMCIITWPINSKMCINSWSPIQILNGNQVDTMKTFGFYISSNDVTLSMFKFHACFNLLSGLLALCILNSEKIKLPFKIILTVLLGAFSLLFTDFGLIGFGIILTFYYLKDKPLIKWSIYLIFAVLLMFNIACSCDNPFLFRFDAPSFKIYRLGYLLVPIVLGLFYNEHAKVKKRKFDKWFFYVFYPGHMLILILIQVTTGMIVI